MNDPIAWQRAELVRRRNHALARARRRMSMGLEIDSRDLQSIDSCQRQLATLDLIELSNIGSEDESW